MKDTHKLLMCVMENLPAGDAQAKVMAAIERLPSDAEFAVMNAEFDAHMASEAELLDAFVASLDADFCADIPAPAAPPATTAATVAVEVPGSTRTQAISIRLPRQVLRAIKAAARERRIPYQTMLKQLLKAGMRAWKLPEVRGHAL